MDKKEYYKKLFSLFEASNNQAEIATDNNAEQENIDPNEVDENMNEEELDDANYLQDEEQPQEQPIPQEPVLSASESLDLEKSKRLFNLFSNLLNYSELFGKALDSIDSSLIDDTKISELDSRKNDLNSVREKVDAYIKDQFNDNKYEKNLYLYVLMRTELLAIIKAIRDLLELNSDENK